MTRRTVTVGALEQAPWKRSEYFLDALIRLHCGLDSPYTADVSYARGGIWKGARLRPDVRLDVRSFSHLTHQASWLDLPRLFAPCTFDCIVWDPIFMPDAGANSVHGRNYGAAVTSVNGRSISGLYEPFLDAARPVLDPTTGTLIAKIANIAHANAYQWQAEVLWRTAAEHGWYPCQRWTEPRRSIDDPKWRTLHVLSEVTVDWLVFHLSKRCPGRGLRRHRSRRCVVCATPFRARAGAKSCSARCRKALSRRGWKGAA